MKKGIHPKYESIKAICSCSHKVETRSTLCKDIHIEVCSKCHPFYTGQQKLVDTAGRIEKFRSKYKKK